jgi:hypothetical protein
MSTGGVDVHQVFGHPGKGDHMLDNRSINHEPNRLKNTSLC